MLGTLLAWMTATTGLGGVSRNAFQLGNGESLTVDGPIAFVLGLILVGIAIARLTGSAMPRYLQRSPVVVALGAFLLLALEFVSLHDWVKRRTSSVVIASIGVGFWVCCAGSLVALFGGALERSE
jgi:FtsH-binding integral membrane protein